MGIKQLLNALMFAEDRDNNKMVIVLLGEAYTYAIIQYTQVHTYSASHSFVMEGGMISQVGAKASRPGLLKAPHVIWEIQAPNVSLLIGS